MQKQINNLPMLPTHWCRALGASLSATSGYQLHSISPIFQVVLAAQAGFAEGAAQSSRSTAVKSSCAHHYVLDGSTLPVWKTSDVTFQILKHEQGLNKLPRTHGECLEHTRRAHVLANVWSRDVVLDPNLLSLDTTSMVADCCQCNSRKHQLQNSVQVLFAADSMQMCIKKLCNFGAYRMII